MLAPSPDDGRLVNVTHLDSALSRDGPGAPAAGDRADRGADRRDDGPHARLPERDLRLLRRPGRRLGAARQRAGRRRTWSRYQALMRDRDLSTHPLDHEPAGRPHEARGRAGRRARWRCTRWARRTNAHHRPRRPDAGHAGPVRRRADGLPGLRHPARRTAATPWPSRSRWARRGCKLHLPRRYSKQRRPVRPPALVALRRDGRRRHLRRRRDPEGAASSWTATPRATRRSSPTPAGAATSCTRRSRGPTSSSPSRFGLGHLIANTTGVVRFDHIQEKLGQIWNMVELTRSALVAAEAGSALDDGGVWYPDDRPVPGPARRDAEVAAATSTSCCS